MISKFMVSLFYICSSTRFSLFFCCFPFFQSLRFFRYSEFRIVFYSLQRNLLCFVISRLNFADRNHLLHNRFEIYPLAKTQKIIPTWILGSSIRSVVPSPSVKRLDHGGAEEPNYQPNVEIQLNRKSQDQFISKLYNLISRPGLPFATSVVSRRENGVDDDQRNIRRYCEEHDHVEWPRDTADRVNFLRRNKNLVVRSI